MKKLFALLLAALMLSSFSLLVSAEGNTTTLTTTVPGAQYTLNIPADQEIAFGATNVEIGNVTVTNSSGFAVGKNLRVTVIHTDFTAEGVPTTIPFEIHGYYKTAVGGRDDTTVIINNGEAITFFGKSDTTVDNETPCPKGDQYNSWKPMSALYIRANSADWGKALGGDYTATITFTAEVVVAD